MNWESFSINVVELKVAADTIRALFPAQQVKYSAALMDDNNTTVPYGGSQREPKAFRNGGSESVLSWQKEGFQSKRLT